MAAETDIGIDLTTLDYTRAVADKDGIGRVNPHRHELAVLTAVVHMSRENHLIVGYVDTTADDFWVRGHFPQMAVMPGVLMCEAAAQLCNYYSVAQKLVPLDKLMGLGGIDGARFRGTVRPGERLVVVARGITVTSRITKFATSGFVLRDGKFAPAFEATILGVPIAKLEDTARA